MEVVIREEAGMKFPRPLLCPGVCSDTHVVIYK